MDVKLAVLILSVIYSVEQTPNEKFCKYNYAKTQATCANFEITSIIKLHFHNNLNKLNFRTLNFRNVTGALNFTEVEDLSNLTVLTVSRSKIDNFIPDSMPNLMFLALVRNQKFPNLNQNILEVEQLNWLVLIGNNHMIEANSLHFLKNLTWLHIQNQKFEHLTAEFLKETTKLQELTIRNCNLSQIDADAFHGLHEIEILSLNFNKLTHFEANTFKNLVKLRILELHHNKFVNFDLDQFRGLTNLEILGLPSVFLKNVKNVNRLLEAFPNLQKMEVKKKDLKIEDVKILIKELRGRNIHIIGTPHDCHHSPCHHVS